MSNKVTYKCSSCEYVSDKSFDECPVCHATTNFIICLDIVDSFVLHDGIAGKTDKKVGKHKKPSFEFKQGGEPSKVTESGWANVNRRIDRENDSYSETVVDPYNGEVIHSCHEKLSEHYGHGTAKFKDKHPSDDDNK